MFCLDIKELSKRKDPIPDPNNPGHFLPNGQSAKSGLNKSILDCAWGTFIGFCEYKAEWYGKNVLKIPTFEPSTILCSDCGFINHNLTLDDREWTCPKCGTTHDRDLNAAINIKNYCLNDKNLSSKEKAAGHVVTKSAELPTLVGALKQKVDC